MDDLLSAETGPFTMHVVLLHGPNIDVDVRVVLLECVDILQGCGKRYPSPVKILEKRFPSVRSAQLRPSHFLRDPFAEQSSAHGVLETEVVGLR
jgi:hypothetical protein